MTGQRKEHDDEHARARRLLRNALARSKSAQRRGSMTTALRYARAELHQQLTEGKRLTIADAEYWVRKHDEALTEYRNLRSTGHGPRHGQG